MLVIHRNNFRQISENSSSSLRSQLSRNVRYLSTISAAATANFIIANEEIVRKVDMLLLISRLQNLDTLKSIRKHTQNRAQKFDDGGFRYIQIAGNICYSMQWTCCNYFMHFRNNFNKIWWSGGSRSMTRASSFLNSFPNRVHLLQNMVLIISDDFDKLSDKYYLINSYCFSSIYYFSNKTTLLIHLIVSL